MSWLIIGSTAAYHWWPDRRPPKDLDLLTEAKIIGNAAKTCVVEATWHELAEEIMQMNSNPVFADPDILFTLKVSHAHWDIHWNKTLFDIYDFQKRGCKLIFPLYEKLVKVWEELHGKKLVNMNQTLDTFWNDAVERTYYHEYVHWCVKFHDRPLHERIRPRLDNAWCDESMFNALTPDEQAQCALEELVVIAIERGKLTEESKKSDKLRAAARAHKSLCTSMTKGWFARFCILNHYNLLYERKDEWLKQLDIALTALPKNSFNWQGRTLINS